MQQQAKARARSHRAQTDARAAAARSQGRSHAAPRRREPPQESPSLTINPLQPQPRRGGLKDLLPWHPKRVGENRAQALVALNHIPKRRFQRARVERALRRTRHRNRCRSRSALPGDRETTADAAQTTAGSRWPRHAHQRRARRLTLMQTLGQRLHGWSFEHAADRNLDIQRGADAADQPRRQQRMAAKLEEVVVDADPLAAQEPRQTARTASPPAGCAAPRRTVLARKLRRRQRTRGRACRWASAAAAPAPQTPTAPCSPEGSAQDAHASLTGSAASPAARHHIGHQPLVAGPILPRNHRRLRHRRMPHQRRLDLARLDAEAAQLDLLIGPPEKVQHPVRAPARQDPRYGTSGSPQAQTGPPQTAPPSDRRGSNSRAQAPLPRYKARPQPQPEQAPSHRPIHKPA